MQSVCDITAVICEKLGKLLPSTYTEININYLHSESSENLTDL